MSSVRPAQTIERTADVVDSSSPVQTQLYGVHNDSNIYEPIQQKQQQITGRTPMWQTRIHLNLNKISKECEWNACFHEVFTCWCRNV